MNTTVDRYEATRDAWLFFAGILLLLRGTVDVVNGLWAIDLGDAHFDSVVLDKFSHWGWVHLIAGLIIVAIGVCVILGKQWAIVTGVVLAGLGIVLDAMWLSNSGTQLHAFFSMLLTILALYGLVVYGMDRRASVSG
jgi:hypothetical protein